MKIEVTISKKHLFAFIAAFTILFGVMTVYAYGTSNPGVMGHSITEINNFQASTGTKAVLTSDDSVGGQFQIKSGNQEASIGLYTAGDDWIFGPGAWGDSSVLRFGTAQSGPRAHITSDGSVQAALDVIALRDVKAVANVYSGGEVLATQEYVDTKVAGVPAGSASQWLASPSVTRGIYYNDGGTSAAVGIRTTDPQFTLHVNGDLGANAVYTPALCTGTRTSSNCITNLKGTGVYSVNSRCTSQSPGTITLSSSCTFTRALMGSCNPAYAPTGCTGSGATCTCANTLLGYLVT